MMRREFWIASALTAFFLASSALAGDSLSHAANKAGKGLKKGVRSAQDKTCELVDGKTQCFGKKVKHKAQNLGDDIKAN